MGSRIDCTIIVVSVMRLGRRQRPIHFVEPTSNALDVLRGRCFTNGAGDQLTNTLVVDVAVRSLMRMLDRQRHHLVDLVVTEPAAQEGQHREMILLRITLRVTTTKPVQHRFQRVTDPPPTLIAEQYERDPSTPKVVQPLSPRGASIGGTPLLPRTLELRICPVQPINAPEGQGAQRHPTLYTTEPPALQH